MESVDTMNVRAGTRIGYWHNVYRRVGGPFDCIGFYYGPDLNDKIPGEIIQWNLVDGPLILRVSVLFRPDLSKRQRLETILIVEQYQEEMWDYADFQKEAIAADK